MNVPSGTLGPGSGPPPPKGTRPFRHFKDLETVPHLQKEVYIIIMIIYHYYLLLLLVIITHGLGPGPVHE